MREVKIKIKEALVERLVLLIALLLVLHASCSGVLLSLAIVIDKGYEGVLMGANQLAFSCMGVPIGYFVFLELKKAWQN